MAMLIAEKNQNKFWQTRICEGNWLLEDSQWVLTKLELIVLTKIKGFRLIV